MKISNFTEKLSVKTKTNKANLLSRIKLISQCTSLTSGYFMPSGIRKVIKNWPLILARVFKFQTIWYWPVRIMSTQAGLIAMPKLCNSCLNAAFSRTKNHYKSILLKPTSQQNLSKLLSNEIYLRSALK